MKIILEIFVYLFISICLLMNVKYCVNMILTFKYFRGRRVWCERLNKKINFIVLVPCLREQNIIVDTIKYFNNMSTVNSNIYLLIACTKREINTNSLFNHKYTSAMIARKFISSAKFNKNIKVYVYEADDFTNGDRASQMNYAVDKFLIEHHDIKIDVISAFDADSRPTLNTFDEVAIKFTQNNDTCYQQPDIYIQSANDINNNSRKYIASANAIYQNQWSMISEIPMLIKYSKSNGNYKWYMYFNGHGEFIPFKIWKNIRFPEQEITDGIHIGYRLAMSGQRVSILDNYCITDAPHNVRSLPKQHKRWYGGCMRIMSCYRWCKSNGLKTKKTMILATYWSQFRWAFTAGLFILNFLLSIVLCIIFKEMIALIMVIFCLVFYCYILCFASCAISPVRAKVNLLTFLLVPIAMLIKSIGPNIYLIERIFHRKQIYEKVER